MGSVLNEIKGGAFKASIVPNMAPSPSDHLDKWLVIVSDLFGEDVLYVRDPEWFEAARAAHPGLVAYAPDEIETLAAHQGNADMLQAVHRIKKKFGGRVRPLPNAAASTV